MAFSSHIYLDPPTLQQHHQQGNGSENPNQQLTPLHPHHVGAGCPAGAGSSRPSSMSDQARLAKIHQPEAAQKCPRCDSSNTKFCYYNNYSLSQPRHFCKACRRYWTRGGALRSVPVGGGCRKNKKNKRSSTSLESPSEKQVVVGNNSNSKNSAVTVLLPTENGITGHLPFMDSLQNLSQYGLGNLELNFFGGIQGDHIGETSGGANRQADHMGFQVQVQQHHLQFPFFDPSNGLYPFHSEGIEGTSSMSPCSRVSQLAPVKMENKSRTQLGTGSENNIQYWGGNSWTNISGLNSSSTTTTNNNLL